MKNEWLFAKTYWSLFRKKQVQQSFLNEYIKGKLNDTFVQLSPSLQFKINYYATWGIVGISEVFTSLFNRELSLDERERATEMSLLFALADELIDEDGLAIESITKLAKTDSSHSLIYKEAQRLLSVFRKNETLWPTLQSAIKAQSASRSQKQITGLSEIRKLTYEKGSWTMLLYRVLVDEPLSVGEEKTVKQLGYCLQLADDLLDVFDDTKEKIATTANLSDLEEAKNHYRDQVKLAKESFFDIYGSNENTTKAFKTFQIMFAISEMALDQYSKNGLKSFYKVDLSELNRKHFIVDMEKGTTVLASLTYCGKQ